MVHFDVSQPPDGQDSGVPTIVFLHAAIGDRRMWHPQWDHFSPTHQLIAIDSRGFGQHPPTQQPFSRAEEVVEILDELAIDRAVLVGGSMGGRVAMEVAIGEPVRVCGLMLLAAPVMSHDWSQPVRQLWTLESAALDRGDIDEAVRVNLEFWIDGPNRDRARLSGDDRALVAEMQAQAFRHELAMPDAAPETRLENFDDHLRSITALTQVIYGDEDPTDMAIMAQHIAATIPHATLHCIADAAHLPSMESPTEINDLLAELLTDL